MDFVNNSQNIEAKILARSLEDEAFRQELLNNPNAAKAEIEKELGQKLPESFHIQVLQETENMAYMVLPATPAVKEELSEEQLEAVAGGYTVQLPCLLWSICIGTYDSTGCFP